jgi:hypothetical protein
MLQSGATRATRATRGEGQELRSSLSDDLCTWMYGRSSSLTTFRPLGLIGKPVTSPGLSQEA